MKYTPTESTLDNKNFVFDVLFKTDQFGCALFTDITVEKLSPIIVNRKFKKIWQNRFLQNIVRSPMV